MPELVEKLVLVADIARFSTHEVDCCLQAVAEAIVADFQNPRRDQCIEQALETPWIDVE
jgi:hypothetical protein